MKILPMVNNTEPIKRYFLFCGDTYYPGGGMSDYSGSFGSIEAAKEALLLRNIDWFNIGYLNDDGSLVLVDFGYME